MIDKVQNESNSVDFGNCIRTCLQQIKFEAVRSLTKYSFQGVKVRLTQCDDLAGETADILTQHGTKMFKNFGLENKMVSWSADSTITTFLGGVKKPRPHQRSNKSYNKKWIQNL